ncbi:GNAT family N-acetyltransferase [Ancylobacter sp. MQZ15Z-1]|uniref:GNAT family N-acetyltransferase n=1 Tax=Ancylobacter mangrovi TaxID=2972472 RepID=A0A9X2T3H5_9HYPH|nr:GNAT family N-acetyltransferase [Ancylobacter mangrovi]MCS0497122.1 GNAT family N-acetyltransferase [Ancylobacter mangrovi]
MSECLRGEGLVVREACEADMAGVQSIYAHHVRHGLASFEEEPPPLAEMLRRRAAVLEAGLPYLVAVSGGEIAGYAYATAYRPRRAYRFTVEDSVYVAEGQGGRGIGSRLLGALIARCEEGPWRQMIAVIGNSANAGSIALHRRHGFADVGTFRSIGFKHGRWVDTVLMQRALGAGDTTPPA